MKPVPDSVRKIVQAVVSKSVQRCHAEAIPLAVFYRHQKDVYRDHPKIGLVAAIEETFRRCRGHLPVDRDIPLAGKGLSIDADG